jgi:hypothetical protein
MLKELNAAHKSATSFRGMLKFLSGVTLAAWAVQALCHIFFKTPDFPEAKVAAIFCLVLLAAFLFIQALIDHAITRRVFIDVELEEADALFQNQRVLPQISVPEGIDPAAIAESTRRTRTRAVAEAALAGKS